MRVTYYAAAENSKGKIEQLLVVRENGKSTQSWTGKIYRSMRECESDLSRLNRKA